MDIVDLQKRMKVIDDMDITDETYDQNYKQKLALCKYCRKE